MTGYLERLAARATGFPAAAAPRPRAWFEDSVGEAEPLERPTVDSLMPAVGTRARQDLGTTVSAPAGSPARAHPPVDRAAGPAAPPVRSLEERTPRPATATALQPSPDGVEEPAGDLTARPSARPADALARTAPPPLPVAARPARTEAPTGGATPETGTAPIEASGPPDTIHVTIGRVEVRATVAPSTPAPQPRTAAPERPVLSLHDYLRGERAR